MPQAIKIDHDSISQKIRAIKRILIANNGLAAVKFITSIRQWAGEVLNDHDYYRFILMVSEDDLKANSLFIQLGQEITIVPSGNSQNNYANVDLIVKIAKDKQVHVRNFDF